MAPRPKSTPSLQSLLDTYHYLVRGLKGDATPTTPRHATATARQMVVPAVLRRDMAATLRTMTPGLGVAGLSCASVRVKGNLFLLSDVIRPFAHIEEGHLTPFSMEEEGGDGVNSDAMWHRWLYAHSAAQAIVMVHPAGAVACATQGIVPDATHFPAAVATIGQVCLVAPDPATWQNAMQAGAPLLVTDGTLITYDLTLAGAIAKADMVARWCEVERVRSKG
jgi:hypothetical protein